MCCIAWLGPCCIKIQTKSAKWSLVSSLQYHTSKQPNKHQIWHEKGESKVRWCNPSHLDVVDLCSCTNGVPPRSERGMICSRCWIEKFSAIPISAQKLTIALPNQYHQWKIFLFTAGHWFWEWHGMDVPSVLFLVCQMGFSDGPKTELMARPSDFSDGLEWKTHTRNENLAFWSVTSDGPPSDGRVFFYKKRPYSEQNCSPHETKKYFLLLSLLLHYYTGQVTLLHSDFCVRV